MKKIKLSRAKYIIVILVAVLHSGCSKVNPSDTATAVGPNFAEFSSFISSYGSAIPYAQEFVKLLSRKEFTAVSLFQRPITEKFIRLSDSTSRLISGNAKREQDSLFLIRVEKNFENEESKKFHQEVKKWLTCEQFLSYSTTLHNESDISFAEVLYQIPEIHRIIDLYTGIKDGGIQSLSSSQESASYYHTVSYLYLIDVHDRFAISKKILSSLE